MDPVETIQWFTRAFLVLLGLAALRLWLRHRTEAGAWLAAAFVALAFVNLTGIATDVGLELPGVVTRVFGLGLLVMPYLLFRFAATFRPIPPWLGHVATWSTVAFGGFSLTGLGAPGARFEELYFALALPWWLALNMLAMWTLWRAGRDEPGVARVRVRLLAVAAGVLVTAVLLLVLLEEGGAATLVAANAVAIVSAVLFLTAFAPPGLLRREWRRQEEKGLRLAERDLMAATSTGEVAGKLVPQLALTLGSRSAAMVDRDGALIASHPDRAAGRRLAQRDTEVGRSAAVGQVAVHPEVLSLRLAAGRLLLAPSPYTPYFGSEEVELLETLAPSIDLAFERVALHEAERRAREEVEAGSRELEALLYGISHDLRSPLVALNGYADILSEELGEARSEEVTFVLGRLRANIEYMDALINDLLELSRIGRLEERAEPVDLTEVMAEVAAALTPGHPEAMVDIAPLPTVLMSTTRARQLLTNLVQNALKHGGRPDIRVQVEAVPTEGGAATLVVRDNGVGIPEEYRNRVFGIFERLQPRGNADPGGTGIGLAICRRIVEQVGGTIAIADVDEGTEFHIRIPAAVVHEQSPLEATT